ncbi:MAG: hypothetical protein HYT38_00280 [Candidatus Sungbacteria bacterium]|uniref:Uncharacterized protein n=1 Tax=Candidatus Sungiibacteriota bacterium TaxID=2750080 RepID=A0A9D6HSE6_9BACT|nr:hypothetical protein [Candidatus Sungbacteria bacterium]
MHFPPDIDASILQAWNGCPKETIQASLAEVFGKMPESSAPKQPEPLLEPVGTITIPAATARFIARDRFVVNISPAAPVKISYIGDNFAEWFLKDDGKTEDPIGEQTLRYARLRQSSVDGPIISELGGEAKAETTLTEMFALMERQSKGEAGILLTDGYANIFYVRDIAGLFRAVYPYWYGDGWYVFAGSVEDPGWWYGGYRVFSSNS